ncbi:polysaccharide biosynthesis tyrosine autokinase [Opitutaceae bacterium]
MRQATGDRSLLSPLMAAPSASHDTASLADFLLILRQRRALVFVIASLVLLTTAGVTALLPKWYRSTAQVRVEKPEGDVKLFQAQSTGAYDPYFLQDQFKIMQSSKILHPVIQRLGLNARLATMTGNDEPLPTDIATAYLLGRMLRLESPRNSSLIDIAVEARDPQLAAEIANEIAQVYSDDRIDFATSGQREGLAQLRRELDTQERNVSAQRDLIEKLRNDLSLAGVDLSARYSDMEIETLRQMQNSLIALRVDTIGRKTRWERFRAIPQADRINLVNSELIEDANIQSLLQAYFVADQNVSRLRSRLGEAHPDLVAAVGNVEKIREQLDGQLRGYESALEIAYTEAQARVAELEEQLARAKVDQILSARERVRPFEEAAQKLEDETRLLTTLKVTLRQREIDFQVPKRTIELLNRAEPARQPARPNWTLNLTFAVLFGSLLGVGAAVLVEYLDTSFRSVADVEARLKVPVLGVIPFATDSPSDVAADPVASEPFRVLHTNLNLARGASKPFALVLLSAGPGEGKSTSLHHLARVMAVAGERVLLIDGDLRRPTQHALAGRPRSPGLGELLLGQAKAVDVIQKGVAPGLDFIPCGAISGLTLGLLHAGPLKELLASLRDRYDRVLIDSPPIIGVSDAAVLASSVDGLILLIQHRRNPQSMVMRAQQVIASLGTPLIGAVLTQVPPKSGEDYGYYTANYAYYRDDRTKAPRTGSKGSGGSPEKITLSEPKRK